MGGEECGGFLPEWFLNLTLFSDLFRAILQLVSIHYKKNLNNTINMS